MKIGMYFDKISARLQAHHEYSRTQVEALISENHVAIEFAYAFHFPVDDVAEYLHVDAKSAFVN